MNAINKYLTKEDFDFTEVKDLYNDFMLITASVGKGKSTFAAKGELTALLADKGAKIDITLMLVPYKNLKDNLINLNVDSFVEATLLDFQVPNKNDDRIRIATVQQFGSWAQSGEILKLPQLILIDEVHRVFKETYYQEQTVCCLHCLRECWQDFICIGLTATPQFIYNYVSKNQYLNFNFVNITPNQQPIIKAKDFRTILGAAYNKYLDVTDIDQENKIVIYTESKKDVCRLVNKMRQNGIKADGIISIYNNDEYWNLLGESSWKTRDILLETGKVACNALVINKSCVEGITINDDTVKTMFIQATDLMTIEQAYGRVRGELDLVIVFINNAYKQRAIDTLNFYREFFKKPHTQENLKKEYSKRKDKDAILVYQYQDIYYENIYAPSGVDYEYDTYISISKENFSIAEIPKNPYEYYAPLMKYALNGHYTITWNNFEAYSLEAGANRLKKALSSICGQRLMKEDKDKICEYANIYREEKNSNKVKYILVKWTTVKKIICDLGYNVEDKKSGKVRYSIINKAA